MIVGALGNEGTILCNLKSAKCFVSQSDILARKCASMGNGYVVTESENTLALWDTQGIDN